MTAEEASRLKQIIAYRKEGISMKEIGKRLGIRTTLVADLLKAYVLQDRARRGIA